MNVWPLKIAAKIILSRLPLDYSVWKSLGLFEFGQMDKAAYALKIFDIHANAAFPNGPPKNSVILELGCGDSLASALIAPSHGVARTMLVDVGLYARTDIFYYKKLAEELRQSGRFVPDISATQNIQDMLVCLKAEYLTKGLQSLRSIPDHSVDFIWSHSVLEHVRLAEFKDTMTELKRILRPGGRISHNVNLKDHLADGLNNLRFSERIWEGSLFANSGFYTNRLRYNQMAQIFDDLGCKTISSATGSWDTIPLSRERLAFPFCDMSEEVLKVRSYHVVLSV